MSAKIISFAQAVKTRQEAAGNGDFGRLFAQVNGLRLHPMQEESGGPTGTLLQRQITEEVFRKKLFSYNVLASIEHVSDLLENSTLYRKQSVLSVTEHIGAYQDDANPIHLLTGANTAFLLFVFYPESQFRLTTLYREFASEMGRLLYAEYARVTGSTSALRMTGAFEPLGTIARDRYVAGDI